MVTVVVFAAATAVGCIVVRILRLRVSSCCTGTTYPGSSGMCIHMVQGHEYGDLTCFTGRSQRKLEKQEPKRRMRNHSEGPSTGTKQQVVQTSEAMMTQCRATPSSLRVGMLLQKA